MVVWEWELCVGGCGFIIWDLVNKIRQVFLFCLNQNILHGRERLICSNIEIHISDTWSPINIIITY